MARRSPTRPLALVLALVAAVAAVAAGGCGTSGDRAEVRAVAERFAAGLRADDGALACRQLADPLREAVRSEADASACADAIGGLGLAGAGVRSVRVFATSALVGLADGSAEFLGETADGWRIDAAGCRPAAEPGPYACRAEA